MELPSKIGRLGLGVAWGEVAITVEGQPITIEDLARAWASIDGKHDAFDAGMTRLGTMPATWLRQKKQ